MFLVLLVVAGNETTRNALTGGLVAFIRVPRPEAASCIDDPSLWDTAVDEIIRYVSPVLSFMRTVTEDHTYQGVDLKAGDKVFMLYQSANRDEDVFDAPDELRVDRDPNPHLALRHRHPLLPRRQPGPGRGAGRVRGAVQAPARHPRAPTARTLAARRLVARAVARAPARGVHARDAGA